MWWTQNDAAEAKRNEPIFQLQSKRDNLQFVSDQDNCLLKQTSKLNTNTVQGDIKEWRISTTQHFKYPVKIIQKTKYTKEQ